MRRFLLLLVSILAAAPAAGEEFRQARYLMGTIAQIHLVADSESQAESAFDDAFESMKQIDSLMSNWKDDSEISKVNRDGYPGPVKIGDDLFRVLQSSVNYSRLTSGAFDVTVGPVVRLWGFIGGEQRVPEESDIRKALESVGYHGIKLDHRLRTVSFAKPYMYVDLGGIAKGHAIDEAVGVLRKNGIRRALVDIGGNIYGMDTTFEGRPWEVEVCHPREDGVALTVLRLKNQAVATSGDYEKFFIVDGKRYSHIIDPRTGRPTEGCVSVTIVARTATEADALSTGVFALGRDKGLELIKKMEGVSALIVTSEMEVVEWGLH